MAWTQYGKYPYASCTLYGHTHQLWWPALAKAAKHTWGSNKKTRNEKGGEKPEQIILQEPEQEDMDIVWRLLLEGGFTTNPFTMILMVLTGIQMNRKSILQSASHYFPGSSSVVHSTHFPKHILPLIFQLLELQHFEIVYIFCLRFQTEYCSSVSTFTDPTEWVFRLSRNLWSHFHIR